MSRRVPDRRSASRCQKVWQAILVLAVLALALAANAQESCSVIFRAPPPAIQVGNRIAIPFSFKIYKEPTLAVRAEIARAAGVEQIRLSNRIIQLEVDQARAKDKLANTVQQSRARRDLEQIGFILAAIAGRGPLSSEDRALISSYRFQDEVVYSGKRDLDRVQDRVVDLERAGATVEDDLKLPPSKLSKMFQVMRKRWYYTLAFLSVASGGVFQAYISYEHRVNDPAFQPQVIQQSAGASTYVPGSAVDDKKTAIP